MKQKNEQKIRFGVVLLLFILISFSGCTEVKKSEPLPFPHWGSPESEEWPARFHTNLDLLAPLGKGTKNAALWFMDFYRYIIRLL